MPNEPMDPQKWQVMIENWEDDYAAAQGDFVPEAGWSGTLQMTRLDKFPFTDKKTGNQLPAWKPYAVVQDGEYEGKEVALGFFTPNNFSILRIVASNVSGERLPTLAACEAALEEACSESRLVNAHTEQNGDYVNVRVDGVV